MELFSKCPIGALLVGATSADKSDSFRQLYQRKNQRHKRHDWIVHFVHTTRGDLGPGLSHTHSITRQRSFHQNVHCTLEYIRWDICAA